MAESLSWRRSCVKSAPKSADDFGRIVARLQRLVYRDTEEFRSELNTVLEELNSLDYSSHTQSEEVSDLIREMPRTLNGVKAANTPRTA